MSNTQQLMKAEFQTGLTDNITVIEQILGQSADIQKRDFMFCGKADRPGVCYFLCGMADPVTIEAVLHALMVSGSELRQEPETLTTAEAIAGKLLISASVKSSKGIGEGIAGILAGDTLVVIEGVKQAIVVSSRGVQDRSIEEPSAENNVRGPRDGFTESLRTNTAQIRKRIMDPNLRFDALEIGYRTKTKVNIAYIQDLVKEGLVEEVTKRLDAIKIDAIMESGNIEELIEDAPLSPFNTIQNTERPDKVATALLEGRVAIMIDNTPVSLIVPTFFWQFLQAPDDYYNRYWIGTFFRIVRYFALLISLMLPSVYVMLVSFHHEMIPTSLALTIASGRDVVPFPVLLEAIIMEMAFELMREAGLRMPKPIGQAVSIVGSLIIGQAAVQAGLVSPFMVIIVAITGIASFAIPNYASSLSIRIFRFPLLLLSGMFGLLGFITGFFALLLHALSLRSFGESYLAPASPFRPSDQRDMLLRAPLWVLDGRPGFAQDKTRMEAGLKPQAPEEGDQ